MDTNTNNNLDNKNGNHIDFFAPKILWFIIGILLLVVVVGASAWWQEIKDSEKTENFPITCSRSYRCFPNQNPANTTDTSTWKTYSSSKYGYQFQYPANLFTEEDEDGFAIKSSQMRMYTGGGVGEEGEEGKDWVRGYIIFVSKEEVKNDIKNLESQDPEYNVTKLNYNNIEAYKVEADVPSSGPEVYIKIPNSNFYIRIGYGSGLISDTEPAKIFDQILSTFKFAK